MPNQNIAFNVEDVADRQCAESVKSALIKLNGVYDVIVDIDSKRVAIEFDEERLNEKILRETIEDAGYKVK